MTGLNLMLVFVTFSSGYFVLGLVCVFFVIFSVSCHYYSANDGRLVTEIKYLILSSGTWM